MLLPSSVASTSQLASYIVSLTSFLNVSWYVLWISPFNGLFVDLSGRFIGAGLCGIVNITLYSFPLCWLWHPSVSGHFRRKLVPADMPQAMTLTVTIKLALLGLNPPPVWFFPLGAASFSVSALVNSVVTALLVLKLVVAHREVNQDGQLGSTQSLLPVIAVLAESGIFTVVAQIIWTVLFGLQNTGFNSVDGSITMIYVSAVQLLRYVRLTNWVPQGITPTIIIVRVTMGKAFAPRSTHVVSSMRFGNKSEAVTSITAQGSSSQLSQKIGNELKVAYVPEHAEKTVC